MGGLDVSAAGLDIVEVRAPDYIDDWDEFLKRPAPDLLVCEISDDITSKRRRF